MHATPEAEGSQVAARSTSQRSAGICRTPQECATMMDAVEQAMQQAQECTPDSHPARGLRTSNLQEWLRTSGLQVPTPAAKDLQALVEAAADNRRLRKQLEALREAELELAAREAEETAVNFSMLEEENQDLAVKNAQLQQRIAELEALAEAAEAAAQARQQQQQCAGSPEPCTPQHQRLKAPGLGDSGIDMHERATSVLKRAAAARRLSGVYEEEHHTKLRQLSEATERLSAMKSHAPASTKSQRTAMQERLSVAERQVEEAAAAAQEATQKLQAVLQEKEAVQEELAALQHQLEAQPDAAAQHAELYTKLLEAQQQLLQEKQQHQRLAGSLLEHAGRLSHQYYSLSDDYDALEHRYHQLTRAHEHLSRQLKEAHEALYEVQTAVQATPVHKRREQQHLVSRLHDAQQAVHSLAHDKQQLQERLLQAHAFISCLQQRGGVAAAEPRSEQHSRGALMQTPSNATSVAVGSTPQFYTDQMRPLQPAGSTDGKDGMLALPAPSTAAHATVTPLAALSAAAQHSADAADTTAAAAAAASFATPARVDHTQLDDMLNGQNRQLVSAEPRDGAAAVQSATQALSWPDDAASPILAAAARSSTVGEHRQRVHCIAARHELQDMQQEQFGLRQEISRAKSALADIAGQLRASIGADVAASTARGHQGKVAAADTGRGLSVPAKVGSINSGSKGQGPQGSAVSTAEPGSSVSADVSSSSSRQHSKLKASASRVPAPGKLQQLQMAAAAVRSASAARSGSSSKGSIAAARAAASGTFTFPDTQQAPDTGAVPRKAGSSHLHWDQLSSGSSSSNSSRGSSSFRGAAARSGARAVASAPAAPAVAAGAPAGASPSESSSNIRSAPAAGASGSGKGSISLGQLIADAESVSLEYGMSPAGASSTPVAPTTTATPAAEQHSSMGTEAATAGSVLQQQQQQFAFTTGQVAATPGSAASSAGAGRLSLNRQWRVEAQYELTPETAVGTKTQPADQQSCLRGAFTGMPSASRTSGNPQQAALHASTPVGLERVASSTTLDGSGAPAQEQEVAAAGLQGNQHSQAYSSATPGVIAGGVTAVIDEGALLQPRTESPPAPSTGPGAAAAAPAAGSTGSLWHASPATFSQGGEEHKSPCQQQEHHQEAEGEVTPVKGSMTTTPAAAVASPPSAIKKAAAALLSSISPAGLVMQDTPEAAVPVSGAAVLSPHLLQHLTPEWLRSLKRKCQQESEQLQLLRRQMGIITPEALSQQHQQLVVTAAPEPSAAAATEAKPGASASQPAAAAAPQDKALSNSSLSSSSSRDATGMQAEAADDRQPSRALVAHTSASSTAAAAGQGNNTFGGSTSDHARSSLGQLSSRSSIDRLRRRAIMAQASAAASPLPHEAYAVVPTATAASAAGPAESAAAAATAASQASCLAPTNIGLLDDQLDRSSSAGSLADYMRQQGGRLDSTGTISRTGSVTPSMLLARPECPTPGSIYSDVHDALSSADDALSGRDSPMSPDLLLAGLRSSRMAARQLQQQLMQQLEKTASMPALPSGHHDTHDLKACSGLRSTSSAATFAGRAAPAPQPEECSSCAGPALASSTELLAVPQGQAPSLSAAAAAEAAPVNNEPVDEAPSSSSSKQSQMVEHVAQPALQEQPAASPITPGAALNAGAESRLLSPGAQLQLVFEGTHADEAGCTATGISKGWEQEEQAGGLGHTEQQLSLHQQGIQAQHSRGPGDSPQSMDGSSCMLLFGVAAKPLPAESAVAAPSPPVSVLSVTPALSSSAPQGSIRAHQISGMPAGTFTASTQAACDSIGPQSCARAPLQQGAAAGGPLGVVAGMADMEIHAPREEQLSGLKSTWARPAGGGAVAEQTSKGEAVEAAGRSSSSSSMTSSAANQTQHSGGPSLGAWAATGEGATAAAGVTPDGTEATSALLPIRSTATTPELQSCAAAGVEADITRQRSSVRGAGTDMPIMLGESPSNKQQQQQQRDTPSHAHGGTGARATPDSITMTSDSCLSSSVGPRVSLGRSPHDQGMSPGPTADSTHTSAVPAAAVAPAAAGTSMQGTAARGAAAAAAAIAEAFAVPRKAVLSGAQGPAAAPAVSSTTWGSGSQAFATPAAAFGSPGGTHGQCSGSSGGLEYYTGLQQSCSSSSQFVAATDATSKHRAAGSRQPGSFVAPSPAEAFAGFKPVIGGDSVGRSSPTSPAAVAAAASSALAPAAAHNSTSGSAVLVSATAQKKLLHELLASPDDSIGSGASQSPTAAAGLPPQDDACEYPAQDASRAAAEAAAGADHAADRQAVAEFSPTLSELGFVAAPAAATVTAQPLQQQQQVQMQGSSWATADLAGLSFEQRLDLLCAEDGQGDAGMAHSTQLSPASMQAAEGATAAERASLRPLMADGSSSKCTARMPQAGTDTWPDGVVQGGMACCGTQTSPLPLGLTGPTHTDLEHPRYKEQGVQVPTPAPQGPPLKQATSFSPAVSTSKATGLVARRPCDVSSSPIKGRDQC